MGNCCAGKPSDSGLSESFLGFDLTGRNAPRVLAKETYFSEDEVYALLELFKNVSSSVFADGLIHKEEFSLAVFKTSKRNVFIDRVFELFDVKRNGVIDFGEFVRALSVFHPRCPIDEKATFAFYMYDLDSTGTIDKAEVRMLLKALLIDNPNMHIPSAAVEDIIDRTFQEIDIDKTGDIDQEEFHALVKRNPAVISYMTLPVLRELTTKFPSFVFHKR